MTSIIIFSIKVASVIGNLITVPRHAQLIFFLSRKVLITPMVVIDNIIKVIIKAVFICHLNKNIIPREVSMNGYIFPYIRLLFAIGSYCANAGPNPL